MNSLAPRSRRPVRPRWPIVVAALLLAFIAVPGLVNRLAPTRPSRGITELYTYQFAASGERFAFLHVEGDRKADLVVFSVPEQKITIYRSQLLTIWSLSANPAKD